MKKLILLMLVAVTALAFIGIESQATGTSVGVSLYNQSNYNFTGMSYDGTNSSALQTMLEAAHGGTTSYNFAGWSSSLYDGLKSTNDAVSFVYNTWLNQVDLVVDLKQNYTIKTFTVIFEDWNGATLKSQTVNYNTNASPPSNPTRSGYNFAGWSGTYTNVTSNQTVVATYTQNTFTVTFKDYDGTILKTQSTSYGGTVTAPSNPTRNGYTFTGWDTNFTYVQSNLTITALYTQNGSGEVGITLPNGVKDTVEFRNGKAYYVQRIKKYTLQASDVNNLYTSTTYIDYVNIKYDNLIGISTINDNYGNSMYTTVSTPRNNQPVDVVLPEKKHWKSSIEWFISFPKGTYANIAAAKADLAGTVIYYQLATPIETEIEIIGLPSVGTQEIINDIYENGLGGYYYIDDEYNINFQIITSDTYDYGAGYAQAMDQEDFSFWQVALSSVMLPFTILSIELMPGLPIGIFALIPIVFGLIAFFFSFKGGKK